jgi:beta-lactamase regulating signal transducer with metallopeptidase domain
VTDYTGPERRQVLEITLRQIEEHVDRIVTERLSDHEEVERRNYAELLAAIERSNAVFAAAFPGGDPEGHRRAHEEQMAVIRDMRDLLREVRNKTVVGLVWAFVAVMGLSLWQYARAKMGLPE